MRGAGFGFFGYIVAGVLHKRPGEASSDHVGLDIDRAYETARHSAPVAIERYRLAANLAASQEGSQLARSFDPAGPCAAASGMAGLSGLRCIYSVKPDPGVVYADHVSVDDGRRP